jgi:hypothetical protein
MTTTNTTTLTTLTTLTTTTTTTPDAVPSAPRPPGTGAGVAELTAVQTRVLRDMAAGYLSLWRLADGADRSDCDVPGGRAAWDALEAAGLIERPDGPGEWVLTSAGAALVADRGW